MKSVAKLQPQTTSRNKKSTNGMKKPTKQDFYRLNVKTIIEEAYGQRFYLRFGSQTASCAFVYFVSRYRKLVLSLFFIFTRLNHSRYQIEQHE
jgi:hypothetical protein